MGFLIFLHRKYYLVLRILCIDVSKLSCSVFLDFNSDELLKSKNISVEVVKLFKGCNRDFI